MLEFIQTNDTLLLFLGAFSVISFFGTLALIPWLVVRLPANYFAKSRRDSIILNRFPLTVRVPLLILKNLFGLLIVLLGIVMLVIPGQGLLTILIGLVLMDFPKKYAFERFLIQRKPVLRTVNWLRERKNVDPLHFDN